MSTSPHDGKRIEKVCWPPDSIDGPALLTETPCQTLHYEVENLGDHGIGWVVLTRDGVEAARHNARHVESIIWKP